MLNVVLIVLIIGAPGIIAYLGCKYLEAREEAKEAGYIYNGNDEER